MSTVTAQQLANAAADCQTLETVVNGSATFGPVTTRLGQVLKTTAYLQQQITIQTGDAKLYATSATNFTDSLGNTNQRSAKLYASDASASATYIQNNITAINAAPPAATSAANSATLAQQWASKSDGTTVDGTSYSAYYWAQKAALIAQTADYVVFGPITLTAGQAAGTSPIALGADPKIAARVFAYIDGQSLVPGTHTQLANAAVSDTLTSNLYLKNINPSYVGATVYGVSQLPTSLTNLNAVSAGAIVTASMQNGCVTLPKLDPSLIGSVSDISAGSTAKLALASAVQSYADSTGRIIQSKLIPVTTTQTFTNTSYADVPSFSDTFTPLKATSKLRVTLGYLGANATAGALSYLKVLVNNVDAAKTVLTLGSGGSIAFAEGQFELISGATTALPIKLQSRIDSGTGRLNLLGAGTALEAGLNTFIRIEEIGV